MLTGLFKGLARGVDHAVTTVAGSDHFLKLLIRLRIGFRILHHFLDVFLGQATGCGDTDRLLLAGRLVFGGDIQDAIGIQIEGHLNLGHAPRRRRDVGEIKSAQGLVARGLLSLTLYHVDGNRSLVVFCRGEHLGFLGGNRGVLLDQGRRYATHGLDAQRQGRNIQQQDVLDITGQNRALDRCTHGNGFVRVHVLSGLLAKEVRHRALHQRHTGLPADQNYIVDFRGRQSGILQGRLHGLQRPADQILHQRLQLGARQLHHQVLGSRGISGDVGQVNLGLLGTGQLNFGLFRSLFEALQRQGIVVQINPVLFLELVSQILDQLQIEVFATQERIPVGREHLKLMLTVHFGDLDHRYIEGAATEVVDRNGPVTLGLVHAVGEGRSRGLVDDALDLQACDFARILGRLTLGVVEVSGDRNNGLCHGLTEELLRSFLHLAQHLGRNLGRRHVIVLG